MKRNQHKKQHVYILLEFFKDGSCTIKGVYADKVAAIVASRRLDFANANKGITTHVLKKSVQGTTQLGAFAVIHEQGQNYALAD